MRKVKSTPGVQGQQSRWVVYRYFAGDGTLLYVGVSCQWARRDADHRLGKSWYGDVARFELEHYDDRSVAARREAEIIQAENPRHNRRRFAQRPAYSQFGERETLFTIHAPASLLAWLQVGADRQNMPLNAYAVFLLENLREVALARGDPPPMGWHKKV